jgi:sulfotransferase family protein
MLLTADKESPFTNHQTRGVGDHRQSINSQPKLRLGYILAASHSGSTLLAMLLGAHSDVCTVGELKGAARGNPDTYRCSCGSLIRHCEFWLKVNAAMARCGFQFEITAAGTNIQDTDNPYLHRLLRPLFRGWWIEWIRDWCLATIPQWHAYLRSNQARNEALIRTLLDISGASLLVDSSKVGLRLKYLLRNPKLDIRVLRLIRDGRAVSLTHTNPAEFADAADPAHRSGGSGQPGHKGLSMQDAALLWRRSNEEADSIAAKLQPSEYMEVRYEQLCFQPEATLQSIREFLGIPPMSFGNGLRSRKVQHVIGNGMRFDTGAEVRLDERWKTRISADDLKIFNRVAGKLNRKYGYI